MKIYCFKQGINWGQHYEAPEDSEDCVVGGEGNGDAEAGSHEEEQEESCSSAKPFC